MENANLSNCNGSAQPKSVDSNLEIDQPNWVFEFDSNIKSKVNEGEETKWDWKISDFESSCSPSDSELVKLDSEVGVL